MKVYLALPYEAYQGHYPVQGRVFSSRAAAEAFCDQKNAQDDLLEWEVEEYTVDQELVDN
jgi:hypothetical protein